MGRGSHGHGHSHSGNNHGHSHGDDESIHGHSHSESSKFCGCFKFSNAARLSTMLMLTFTFFLVELIVGHLTKSVSMTADAFHMLSDVLALLIGLVSTIVSKKKSNKNTYGWVRAEILGALINSVFLISLCFSIFIEAVERFFQNENIERPHLLLYVGIGGLTINLVGLFIFGHGHSHAVAANGSIVEDIDELVENEEMLELIERANHHHHHHHHHNHRNNNHSHNHHHGHDESKETNETLPFSDNVNIIVASPTKLEKEKISKAAKNKKKSKESCCNILSSEANMNMRAVFLHVLADALGSVAVIISALINIYHNELKLNAIVTYIDPFLSLILIALILSSTIPLVKDTALILLQTAPSEVDVEKLKRELTEKIPGIISVHEMHIWMLSPRKFIATAHIACECSNQYMQIARQVKEIFHKYKIHSTTIQPEFKDHMEDILDEKCKLECQKACTVNTCCGGDTVASKKSSLKPNRSSKANDLKQLGSSSSSEPEANATDATNNNNNNNNQNTSTNNDSTQTNNDSVDADSPTAPNTTTTTNLSTSNPNDITKSSGDVIVNLDKLN